jgi:hypothetical protein
MSNIKKLMMSAAGGAGLDVDEVFSTYLWVGDESARNIVNNIDLSTEGGLVWIKNRDTNGMSYSLVDTVRGANKILTSNSTSGEIDSSGSYGVNGFNTNGFSLPSGEGAYYENKSGKEAASWTFRKTPKFFDIQTWTGNGVNGRSISHSLNSKVGMIVVKSTSTSGTNWATWHRGASGTLWLNSSLPDSANGGGQATSGFVYNPGSNTTSFTVDNGANVNQSGRTYVAYLFAHNDGDGGFGPDGDQDIIKCGLHTISTTDADEVVDLGFEAQWVLTKTVDANNDWVILDTMRGLTAANINDPYLRPNTSNAEGLTSTPDAHAKGFTLKDSAGRDFIYVAIRRGSLFPPESATDVFAAAYQNAVNTSPGWTSGFPVDMALDKNIGGGSTDDWTVSSRLTQGKYFYQIATTTEGTSTEWAYDFMDGWREYANNGPSDFSWMWKRAPGFFDVVAYTGTGTSGYATINHNLGVVPEMVWFKNRSSSATPRGNWYVYHKDLANAGGYLYLNSTSAEATDYSGWATGSFAPTDTGFTVLKNTLHYTNENYIAYFFATVAGVSKVGSFTGNGSSLNVDCGFSSGARFVLVRALNSAGAWFLFDTARGIVSGNDPQLSLNNSNAEDSSRDLIDPLNSGFTINYNSDYGNQLNGNGQTYIFYAIA